MTRKGRLVAFVVGAALLLSLSGPVAQAAPKGCTLIATLSAEQCSWTATKNTDIVVVIAGSLQGWVDIYISGSSSYRCAFAFGYGAVTNRCYVYKGWVVKAQIYGAPGGMSAIGVLIARQVK